MNPPEADHGYGRPSVRPRLSVPATYHSGTPRHQHPAVVRLQAHLRGLVEPIHETSGLSYMPMTLNPWTAKIPKKEPKWRYQNASELIIVVVRRTIDFTPEG